MKLTEWFQKVARYHLDQYATKLKQDLDTTKSEEFESFPEIQKNLILLALAEKQILHAAGSHYASKGKELEAQLEKIVEEMRKEDELL